MRWILRGGCSGAVAIGCGAGGSGGGSVASGGRPSGGGSVASGGRDIGACDTRAARVRWLPEGVWGRDGTSTIACWPDGEYVIGCGTGRNGVGGG